MINTFCPRCGRLMKEKRDCRLGRHKSCAPSVNYYRARLTKSDWNAVAGWLNPRKVRLIGQMGNE